MHIIAAKAVAFHEALQPEFKPYAAQIVANAKVLGEAMQAEGYRVISGGTDTHLMLVDVFRQGILGSEAESALHEAGITVNKNAIPYDTNPPMKPAGIRIGTPALTTRGMRKRRCAPSPSGSRRRSNSARTRRRCAGSAARCWKWRRVPALRLAARAGDRHCPVVPGDFGTPARVRPFSGWEEQNAAARRLQLFRQPVFIGHG